MIGAQKADFRFKANGLPVEDVLSRGQLKLLMCALRLAQGEHLVAQKQRQCLFLIDDFASELDPTKRELLAHRLREVAHKYSLPPLLKISSIKCNGKTEAMIVCLR